MDLLALIIFFVGIGICLWIGWTLAPFVVAAVIVYIVVRYPRETKEAIKGLFKGAKKK